MIHSYIPLPKVIDEQMQNQMIECVFVNVFYDKYYIGNVLGWEALMPHA